MRENKGFSLIEAIVVMAIMALLTGMVTYSFGLVTGQEARQCANNLSAAMDKAKSYALSKSGSSDAYLEILRDADQSIMVRFYIPQNPVVTGAVPGTADYLLFEEQKVGKRAVEVICNMVDGTAFPITETAHIRIYYDRISGAFKQAIMVDTGVETAAYCNNITISRGKTYQIQFINATGKHILDRVG